MVDRDENGMREPDWVRHAVWWQVYPLGLVGAFPPSTPLATGTPDHRLGRLADWLDYALQLGASGIALGPIFASETHGYDTIDYFRIDPRLGDENDFATLISAAHRRGLKVLLDGVFNHVGRAFPTFATALERGPSALESKWFRLEQPDDSRPGEGPQGAEPQYATFEGHGGLMALDHDEPAVADFVARVMSHWLRAGADGWRLDAAYAVPPRFWARVLPRVRAAHPDAWFVGEVIHGDYEEIVRDGGLDSVTQYELWKAMWSSIDDQNFFELAWALERHNGFLDSFAPLTFVGNHDVTRIASRIADERHLPHAIVVLLTVGGTPSIYAGDEQAFRGIKEDRAGGDDAVRPPFPADGPAGLAPDGWSTYRLHQQLIGLRRRNAWLHRAKTTTLHLTNTQFVYEAAADAGRIVVALNLDDAPLEVHIDGRHTLLAGAAELAVDGPGTRGTVPPHGWAVLG